MEEKINHIFDEKMSFLKDLSKKNITKMDNVKDDLELTIKKLKCNVNKLVRSSKSIDELKQELKNMKERRDELVNEIKDIKREIQTLNHLSDEEKPDQKLNIKDILFTSTNEEDHEFYRNCFKEIGEATKEIQQKLKNNEISKKEE